MPGTVQLAFQNTIAHLTFSRPKAMNTFNGEMSEDLRDAVNALKQNKTIRAVLVKGAGPCFMAGGDVKAFYENLANMPGDIREWAENLHQAIHGLKTLPVPVVAQVHGSVAGAGISIMMACDLVLASDDCIFNFAYLKLGLSPDGGATYQLPRMVGHKKAMELLMLSERFDAYQAMHYGMVNRVYEPYELEADALLLVDELAAGPTQAYAKLKTLMNETDQNDLITQMNLEADLFTQSTTTQDFAAGVTAFVKKCEPVFEGR